MDPDAGDSGGDPLAPSEGTSRGLCIDLTSPHAAAGVAAYDVVNVVPTLLFLSFLAWRLRRSLRRLAGAPSHIQIYYAFLWGVCILNVVRCCVQMVQVESPRKAGAEGALWLVTRFGMVSLEVSVVVFLLQAHASGEEALHKTLWVSGAFAVVDAAIKASIVYGAGVPLFLFGREGSGYDELAHPWPKYGFWLAHSALFLATYAVLGSLPHTRWRDLLPARPEFYTYVWALAGVYVAFTLGSLLVGCGASVGYCVYGLGSFTYYSVYPVLLYAIFLGEFFHGEEADDGMMAYSELQDPVYFDDEF